MVAVQSGWMAIERTNPDTEETVEWHVLPVREVPSFDTYAEAATFIARVEAENDPMVERIDDAGESRCYTHFGHTRSSECHCRPTREFSQELPVYLHAYLN